MRSIYEGLVRLVTWVREETAQTMAEYALILALISIAAIAVLVLLGPAIAATFTEVTNAF